MEGFEHIGFAVALLAGTLSFLSPCVLPLVPSYLSFVTGIGAEELARGGAAVRQTSFIHSLFFVLGFSLIFIGLGAGATLIGTFLRQNQIWVSRVGGGIVILFGLYLLGLRPGLFLARERRFHLRHKPVGYLGTTLVGITFGAGWTPCIGPILGGILTLAASTGTVSQGVLLLAFYSAGLAIPFLLASLAFSWFLSTFARFRRFIPWIERASGALLILVGGLLLTGRFTQLAAWAARYTPEFIFERI